MTYAIVKNENWVCGRIRIALVDGERVHFPGFTEYEFFQHETLVQDRDNGIGNIAISERTTGAVVAIGWNPKCVFNDALTTLIRYGKDGLDNAIQSRLLYIKSQIAIP